jgi:D-amino-acid dehydrogenase
MDIIVIGAGVVGLTSAWYLRQDGHRVTIVDRAAEVGQGTSHANGGQLSYRYIAPLADPDVLAKIPGWMLRNDAPVRFRMRFDPEQWRWLASFLTACNGNDKLRSVASLLPLSLLSQALIRELVETHALAFDFVRNGKLVVHRDGRDFDSARALLAANPELAGEQQALDPAECLALEPALERLEGKIRGGIHTRSEDAGDCLKLCQALAERMTGGDNPVRFELGQELCGFERKGMRVTAVRTAQGSMSADACVVAAGTGAVPLLRGIGVRLPIYPVKGYSINVGVGRDAVVPTVSVTDFKRKVVYAPIGTHLRAAGMADIVGADERIEPDRIATLVAETRAVFGDWVDRASIEPWTGMRPATPTGRPIVDTAGADNLWMNVGHGALGFTLATGCARILADRIAGRMPAVPYADFQLAHASPSGWRTPGRSHAVSA